jgi:hypothetical protein
MIEIIEITLIGLFAAITAAGFYSIYKVLNRTLNRDYKYCINIHKEAFMKSKCPFIKIKIRGVEKWFLIDTGAQFNLINDGDLDDIYKPEDMLKIVDEMHVVGTVGHKEKQSVLEETIEVGGEEFVQRFSVADMSTGCKPVIDQSTGLKMTGILGAEFFNEVGWLIDMDSLVICAKKDRKWRKT